MFAQCAVMDPSPQASATLQTNRDGDRDEDVMNETLEQLGDTIRVMVTKSDNYLLSAGLKLLEARKRVDAGEGSMTWSRFLVQHCGGLSRQRANELIQIAEGKKTVEETRERARRSMVASRERRSRPNRLATALRAFDALSAVERVQFLAARGLTQVDIEVEFDDAEELDLEISDCR
jgi:hypothetical protein